MSTRELRAAEIRPLRKKTAFACSALVGRHVVHRKISPHSFSAGKWTYDTEDRDVILMCVVGAWAMVRRPKCAPYVCYASELLPPNEKLSDCP
jgi:hypothetical protein